MAAQVQPMSTTNGHDPRALMVRPQGLTAIIPNMPTATAEDIERALTIGDLSKMPADVRIRYYLAACESASLNPLTRPFTPMKTQSGEVILYANKEAAEQLRKIHRLSVKVLSRVTEEGLYTVTVQGTLPDGREDEAQGIVEVTNLKGTALGNARMKAESKAKRRLTMAMIGLGFGLIDDAPGVPVRMELSGAFRGEDFEADVETVGNRDADKTAQEHIDDLAGTPTPRAARQADPVCQKTTVAEIHTTLGDIHALHLAHGQDENWIDRYWDKILKRLRVTLATTLSPEQLDGLYAEAVQVYAKQAAEKAETEPSAPIASPRAPEDSEGTLGAPVAPSDDSTPYPADVWRNMLAGLVVDLCDATLALEAQSILEDAEASDEAGSAMITRVLQSIEAALEEEGQSF